MAYRVEDGEFDANGLVTGRAHLKHPVSIDDV